MIFLFLNLLPKITTLFTPVLIRRLKQTEDYENLQAVHLRAQKQNGEAQKQQREQISNACDEKAKMEEQLERAATNLQRTQEQMNAAEHKLVSEASLDSRDHISYMGMFVYTRVSLGLHTHVLLYVRYARCTACVILV